jgi:hypothetical protein
MTNKKLLFGLTALMITASLTLTSCHKKKKNEPEEEDTEQSSATDNHYAETTVNDITAIGSQGSENGNVSTYRTDGSAGSLGIMTSSCTNVTFNTIAKTFTVDFGTVPCTCLDGKKRSGMLIYDYSATTGSLTAYRAPGFSCNVSSSNYVVDGYTVNIISKNIKNTTPSTISPNANPGINLSWAINANVQILKPGGGTISYTSTRSKILLNTSDATVYGGQSVPINWTKAKIEISGNSTGTNSSNETFTSQSNQLVRDFNCAPDITRPHRHPFISGTMVYTPGTRPTRTLDFGSGTCDFNATLIIKGNTYAITLP